jgi:hypothetical protein
MPTLAKNKENGKAFEKRSLKLVSDLQAELQTTLRGLTGHTRQGLYDGYIVATAGLCNRMLDGYVVLRESSRIDASKFFIRPAIEVAFRLQAVQKKPELLFRFGYSEFEEDRKWLNAAKARGDAKAQVDVDKKLKKLEDDWKIFKGKYQTKYPGHPLKEQVIKIIQIARDAGIEFYYDSHYRLYSQITHAALRVTTGTLNILDPHDNRAMALCALVSLDAIKSAVGVKVSNLDALRERLAKIDHA